MTSLITAELLGDHSNDETAGVCKPPVLEEHYETTSEIQEAAANGDPVAQRLLGLIYLEGSELEQDTETGLNWLQRAIQNGDVEAHSELAHLYLFSEEVEEDVVKAHRLLQTAANRGSGKAHAMLGVLYKVGWGCEVDAHQSIRYAQRALNLGHDGASNLLLKIGYENPTEFEEETGTNYWERYDQEGAVGIAEAESSAWDEGEKPSWSRFFWSLLGFGLFGYFTVASGAPSFTEKVLFVGLVAAIILFHELGHYLAMAVLGYKNPQIMFMPLGGMASGQPDKLDAVKEFFVLIMGPLPGLVLGMLLFQYGDMESRWIGMSVVMLLLVNAFNLLPIYPLDGGRIWDYLIFRRLPRLKAAFHILCGLLLTAYIGYDLYVMFTDHVDDPTGWYIWNSVFLLFALRFLICAIVDRKMSIVVAKAALTFSKREVRENGCLPDELTPKHVRSIRECLPRTFTKTDPDFDGYNEAVSRTWMERFKPAGVLLSVLLFAVYIGAWYPLYGAGAHAMQQAQQRTNTAHELSYTSWEKYQAGEFEAALSLMNKAIDLAPHGTYYANRGNVRMKLKDYPGAVADFDVAISQDRSNGMYYRYRAESKLHMDDRAGGCQDMTEGQRLGAPEPPSWMSAWCMDPNEYEQFLRKQLAEDILSVVSQPRTGTEEGE